MSTSDTNRSIQEQVNEKCNELYASGTKPTVRLILSMLPSVSSTSTVHKYVVIWKDELKANQESLYSKLGFSSEFTQSFMKEITRFSVEAEHRYKEESQDAKEQRDLAIESLSSAEDKLFKQQAVVEKLTKEIAELHAELKAVNAEHKLAISKEQDTSAAIVSELRKQLEDESKASEELAKSNESLRTQVATVRLKLEGNQQYVDEVKSQSKLLTGENKALTIQISDLLKSNASQESMIAGNDKLISNLESSLKEGQRFTANVEQENNSLKSQLEKLSANLNAEKAERQELAAQLERSNVSIVDLKNTVAEQSAVIAKLTSK